MLLNEMQKQQREIKAQAALAAKQSARIAELERERREQMARIEALEKRSERMAGLLDRLQLAGVRTAAAR
jgi:predicted RNase H-like nuclease (RuvC/YqgF family)